MKIDVPLDGTFVASKMTEVPFRPEAWTDYEIVEVVEHGNKVHKGETLFKFDDEKINEAIADLELEQRLNELAIMQGRRRNAAHGKDAQAGLRATPNAPTEKPRKTSSATTKSTGR